MADTIFLQLLQCRKAMGESLKPYEPLPVGRAC